MSAFRVVLIEHGYADREIERAIITAAGGEFIDAEHLSLPEALRLCENADVVMLRRITVTAEMLAGFSGCKLVIRYGVGTDNVDVAAATERGIMVGHVPTYCVDEVATHALALLLACVRDLPWAHQRMQGGAWDVKRTIPLYRMQGKTLGIVGLGQIGCRLARLVQNWGLTLLASDPWVEPERAAELGVSLVDLPELCRRSDTISLHAPLLPETHHLISTHELSAMKPTAILVNTARGGVVDTAALLAALDAGKPARAALDVFEEEPLPPDSPLRAHPRVLLSDHMAWYSEDSQLELRRQAAELAVQVGTGGLPGSLANPQVLGKLGRYDEWQPAENMRWQLRRLAALSRPISASGEVRG